MKKHLLFVSFLWVLFSCTNKLTPNRENKNVEKITEYSEDLSIFRPKNETSESVNTDKSDSPKTQSAQNNSASTLKNENENVEKVLTYIKENNKKAAEGKGYRIQVFSGNNKLDFEAAKSYLYRNFSDLELYESYSCLLYTSRCV